MHDMILWNTFSIIERVCCFIPLFQFGLYQNVTRPHSDALWLACSHEWDKGFSMLEHLRLEIYRHEKKK